MASGDGPGDGDADNAGRDVCVVLGVGHDQDWAAPRVGCSVEPMPSWRMMEADREKSSQKGA